MTDDAAKRARAAGVFVGSALTIGTLILLVIQTAQHALIDHDYARANFELLLIIGITMGRPRK